MLKLSQFDYQLPLELIANEPASPRDASKLMVIDRRGPVGHHIFRDLPGLLKPDDVLVFNQTKVFPARLYGQKTTGGKVEILLLALLGSNTWEAISSPGLKVDQIVTFDPGFQAEVLSVDRDGVTKLQFNISGPAFWQKLDKLGIVPLPPYIKNTQPQPVVRKEYQTVYAKETGSAAAPTAGLHFTPELLGELGKSGIELGYLTLHVGLGTFKPVTSEKIEQVVLHKERYFLPEDVAERLNKAKELGRRVISVGTTTCRVLEGCSKNGKLVPGEGETSLFIKPPYKFQFVDGLITNFHLPKSSLLMLVSAFACAPNTEALFTDFSETVIGKAYREAIKNKYRFFSFGDASLII